MSMLSQDDFFNLEHAEYQRLQPIALKQAQEDLKIAWDKCRHLHRFETWADLYLQRYHRLSPGKDESAYVGRNSNDPENRAQCDAWHKSGLASLDAIMALGAAHERIEELEARIEELEDQLENQNETTDNN